MKRNALVGLLILFLAGGYLTAQHKTLLIRFSPDVSPLAMALGGLGTTLPGDGDGLFFNPALAVTLSKTALQGQMLSSTIGGEWPIQIDSVDKRQYIYEFQGDMQGSRAFTVAHPRHFQALTLAICGGWLRLMPYGLSGQGIETWADLEKNMPQARTTRTIEGHGGLDALWLGAALGDQQVWGVGIHHTFWNGEGTWVRSDLADPDLAVVDDETSTNTGRSERLSGGFWTVGAYFRPHDQVLLTTSFQSRTQGVLQIRFLGEDLPEGVEADDSLQATLVVPESLTLGLRLGPVENTAFHAEYHTRFWSRATLGDHPLGTIFPGMEAGLTQQRNEARLALGLSHRLTLKGMLSCLLAAGLSWNQPLFVGDDGEPRIIRSQHLGAKLQIGNHLALAAAIRLSRGSWPRAGVYDPEEEFTYSMTRSTLMLGVDFYPEGLK